MPGERIVAVKLPEDVYRELERRARRLGYSLVADYVRELILRELGYSSGASGLEDVRSLVEQELKKLVEAGVVKVEAPSQEELVEQITRRLERKVQDMINPWTAKIDTLSTRLAEIVEKLEALEEKISEIESREKKEGARAEHVQPRFQAHMHAPQERRGRRRSAIERLRDQGVVFEHEVQWLRDRDAFFEKLKREGALVFEIGGERVAVDPAFWESFREKLSELPTANDEEVRFLLTRQQYELYRRLKESGAIYFDASERRWKFAEEPKPA